MTPPVASRDNLLPDLVAGLSIAGLLLPEAVAYSAIGGMPPQAGVIALFAGLLAYGLLGTSRFAIVSATSSSAAVLLAATASIDAADPSLRLAAAACLVLMTGVLFVVAGLLRLGDVSNFIAKPVLRGFTFGIALTITVRQLPKIAGIAVPSGNVFETIGRLAAGWHGWNLGTLEIGIGALVALGLLARWHRLPAALIVIAAGIAVDASGFTASHGVPVVGPIALTLEMPQLPDLAWRGWLRSGELAAAMVLILYAESYGSIRSFALLHGDAMRPDRDLFSLGAANLLSGLFQGMPVGAGFSATSANEAAGARSRAAGFVAAGAVLALVLALLPWIARTPEPVLAAIVIHAVGRNIDPGALRQYFTWQRDRRIAVAAVVAVFVLGVLDGLLVAIGASLALMLRELSKSRVGWLGRLGDSHNYIDLDRHGEARPVPGVLIARPDTPVFFANAERIFAAIRARVEADAGVRTVIVSLEDSPDLDTTSIEALREFTQVMGLRGVAVLLARVKDHVRDVLQRVHLAELPPECYSSWSVADAVRLAERRHAKTRLPDVADASGYA